MFAIRRAAARALASPSLSTPIRSRSIRTSSLIISRCQPKSSAQLLSTSWQRRWASDDATAPAETRGEPTADGEIEHSESALANSSEVSSAPETAESETLVQRAANATQKAIDQSSAPESFKDAAAAVTRTASSQPSTHGIFIGNLYYHVTNESLKEKFGQFGRVVKSNVAVDERGMSKGFAFVHFDSAEAQQAAIEKVNNTLFEGRTIGVAPANVKARPRPNARSPRSGDLERPTQLKTPSRTLWVGNMSYDMTDSDLNNLFRPLKNVVDVRVAVDRRTGQARGFAHADFKDVESATEAMEYLRNQVTYGRRLRLDYAASFDNEKPGIGRSNDSETVEP